MADNDVDVNEELLDFEDDPETETPAAEAGAENGGAKQVRRVFLDYIWQCMSHYDRMICRMIPAGLCTRCRHCYLEMFASIFAMD